MPQSQVTVEFRTAGKGKGKKSMQRMQEYESSKTTNYDLLLALGFDRTLLDQNKRLGLKEKTNMSLKQYVTDHNQEVKNGIELVPGANKDVRAQIYAKQVAEKSQIVIEECDDWKYVSITPPPKTPVPKGGLIPIGSLPPFARQAFHLAETLNQI